MTFMFPRFTPAMPTAGRMIVRRRNDCGTDHRVRMVPATTEDAVEQHRQQC